MWKVTIKVKPTQGNSLVRNLLKKNTFFSCTTHGNGHKIFSILSFLSSCFLDNRMDSIPDCNLSRMKFVLLERDIQSYFILERDILSYLILERDTNYISNWNEISNHIENWNGIALEMFLLRQHFVNEYSVMYKNGRSCPAIKVI